MNDDSIQTEIPGKSRTKRPSEGTRRWQGRKAKLIGIISGITIAATPGIYGAYRSAQEDWKDKLVIESITRDKQEKDLHANVKSNELGISLLKESCVTHKELLAIVIKMQEEHASQRRRPTRQALLDSGPPKPGTVAANIETLKIQAKANAKVAKKYEAVRKAKPALKSAKSVRQQVQQQITNKAAKK